MHLQIPLRCPDHSVHHYLLLQDHILSGPEHLYNRIFSSHHLFAPPYIILIKITLHVIFNICCFGWIRWWHVFAYNKRASEQRPVNKKEKDSHRRNNKILWYTTGTVIHPWEGHWIYFVKIYKHWFCLHISCIIQKLCFITHPDKCRFVKFFTAK